MKYGEVSKQDAHFTGNYNMVCGIIKSGTNS